MKWYPNRNAKRKRLVPPLLRGVRVSKVIARRVPSYLYWWVCAFTLTWLCRCPAFPEWIADVGVKSVNLRLREMGRERYRWVEYPDGRLYGGNGQPGLHGDLVAASAKRRHAASIMAWSATESGASSSRISRPGSGSTAKSSRISSFDGGRVARFTVLLL